ncbi:MAG: hypothetical protein K5930_13630 [Treponemataceae bacterium]|nr:hypothetical protein [Treponemataceae bacterium]
MISPQLDLIQSAEKREYQDRLFKAVFGRDTEQSKRWRLDLYNALNDTSYTDPDALELNTIENVIYITMRNDISFLIDNKMTLYEQQSTHNPNMPLRGFLYFSQLYQLHLTRRELDIHRSKLIRIPAPRFIVFYNGQTEKPDTFKLYLSDSFEPKDQSGDFQWTATVININTNHNTSLQKKCKPLYHYIQYVSRVTANKKKGLAIKEAVDDAVDWAIKENLLEGFFKIHKEEVLAMSLTEFNLESAIKGWREDGFEDGKELGRQEKAVEAAREFLKENIPPETIAKCVKLPLEKVQELAEELSVKV